MVLKCSELVSTVRVSYRKSMEMIGHVSDSAFISWALYVQNKSVVLTFETLSKGLIYVGPKKKPM